MASAVFKTVVGGEEPPGCVRFARASAIACDLRERTSVRSRSCIPMNGDGHPRVLSMRLFGRAGLLSGVSEGVYRLTLSGVKCVSVGL